MQLGFCICAHSHSEEEITTVLAQQSLVVVFLLSLKSIYPEMAHVECVINQHF
jgi:hypothetical protein